MSIHRSLGAVAAVGVAALALAGCVAKSDVASGALTVTSTADTCAVSTGTAKSGTLAFDITNNGTDISEFYLLAEDGLRIVGEVENIAPGAKRTLNVVAQPGTYYTLCKPGMVGDGVGRASFTVSGDRVQATGDDAAQKQQAVDLYAAFVKDQVEKLVPAVQTFTAAYVAGDDEAAKAQFPQVRAFYERIEPVAESLGTLDPRIDYRELDAVAEGIPWTGFHRIEKDLWVPATDALNSDSETSAHLDWSPSTQAQRQEFADKLNADVEELNAYVHSADFKTALDEQSVAGLSNGAIALLNEVASGKITGEEDWWSGTDLSDFAANVEGSKMAFSLVHDLASTKDGPLVAQIDAGYAALEAKLAAYGSPSTGFVTYSALTDADRRALTDAINALAEPLSKLTSTVLS